MSAVRLVTLAGDAEAEAELAGRLGAHPKAELVMRCVDRIELFACLRGGAIDAVVSVGAPAWFDRQAADEAARAGVLVVGVVSDAMDAERLARMGASLVPADAGVEEILERCLASPGGVTAPEEHPVRSGGRLVAVWGPKGAPGRTSIACELAAAIALTESETLLLDGDPYGGDVLQLLGLLDELPTVIWAARAAGKGGLDPSGLREALRRAGPRGPWVLPGLPRSDLWADVADYGWRELLVVARGTFAHTVCDTGFCIEPDSSPYGGPDDGRNRMARALLRDADDVVAVCRADPLGLKSFLWSFDPLRELVDADRIKIVANRVRAGDEREVKELLKRHLGRGPIIVPDRPADFARAVAAGRNVLEAVPRSDVCEAVRALASAVGGAPRPAGVLARLGGRA